MGRNPVVGRQGPGTTRPCIPPEDEGKRARGEADPLRRSATPRPCGGRSRRSASGTTSRPSRSPNTASIRGMLFKVRHLVEVTPAKEKREGERSRERRHRYVHAHVGDRWLTRSPCRTCARRRARPKPRKRVGRGPGSGLGKTSGKGHKGHKARTGGSDQSRLRGRPDADVPAAAQARLHQSVQGDRPGGEPVASSRR